MIFEQKLYESSSIWEQDLQLGQKNLIQAIKDFFPQEVGSCLDVGCGDGKITKAISEVTGISFVGLDASKEALAHCQFTTMQGDASSLPFNDEAFDLVMCCDMLEHLSDENEKKAWQQLFRVAANWVIISVPYREELLDATTLCLHCGTHYHVNWHQRSYDIHNLLSRVPKTWQPVNVILSGEPWSTMHPIETRFRREFLKEWADWDLAMCPSCGKQNELSSVVTPLSKLSEATLGKTIYANLKRRRLNRSHSELLIFFARDGKKTIQNGLPSNVKAIEYPATLVNLCKKNLEVNLISYPQIARAVAAADGNIILQFPLYEDTQTLSVFWDHSCSTAVKLSVEDGLGVVFDDEIFPPYKGEYLVELPRLLVSGYYGILIRIPFNAPISKIQIGQGPIVQYLKILDDFATGYHSLGMLPYPCHIQVSTQCWFDIEDLSSSFHASESTWSDLYRKLEVLATLEKNYVQSECQTLCKERNILKEDYQNLQREHNILKAEQETLLFKNEIFILENGILKSEHNSLKKTWLQFNNRFDIRLCNMLYSFFVKSYNFLKQLNKGKSKI